MKSWEIKMIKEIVAFLLVGLVDSDDKERVLPNLTIIWLVRIWSKNDSHTHLISIKQFMIEKIRLEHIRINGMFY